MLFRSERVLGASGWRLDYLGGTTYLARFGPQTFEAMSAILDDAQGGTAEKMQPIKEQLQVLGPLLDDYRVHFPVWSVVATRLD